MFSKKNHIVFIVLMSFAVCGLSSSGSADVHLTIDEDKEIILEKISYNYIKDETERDINLLQRLFSDLEKYQSENAELQRTLDKWKRVFNLSERSSVDDPYSNEIEPLLEDGGELYYYKIDFLNYFEFGICILKEGKMVFKHCESSGFDHVDPDFNGEE